MARGDVAAQIVSVSASGSHSIQPGSGVEWIIKTWVGNNSGEAYLEAWDGTLDSVITIGNTIEDRGGIINIPVNNSDYIRMRNNAGGYAIKMAYYGFITKE